MDAINIVVLVLTITSHVSASYSEVELENNRYTGIVVAIDGSVKEDPKIIEAIKVLNKVDSGYFKILNVRNIEPCTLIFV